MRVSKAGARMLATLEDEFEVHEDYGSSDCPPSILVSATVRRQFKRGESRTLLALQNAKMVAFVEGTNRNGLVVRRFKVMR